MEPNPQKKKSGRSCFLVGCLSLVAVFIIAIVVLFLGARYYINKSIQQYTEATPVQFEPVTLSDEESKALETRVQEFNRNLQDTNKTAQIVLDSRELNALMAKDSELSKIASNVRVKLEGDQLTCLISFPLDELSKAPFLGGLKGRYLNGTAKVRVSLNGGNLSTKVTGISVKNEELPSEALTALEQNPRWQEMQHSPEVQKLIGKIDWLKITDGKVELGTGKPAP